MTGFMNNTGIIMPSVRWCCWLGNRNSIRQERHPAFDVHLACKKTEWWGAGVVICLERAATCIWPSWRHCHSLSLASVKSRLVLPFWYGLTSGVLLKMEVGIRKGAWRRAEGTLLIYDHWGEYTLSKKPGGWYTAYTRVYPPIHHWGSPG